MAPFAEWSLVLFLCVLAFRFLSSNPSAFGFSAGWLFLCQRLGFCGCWGLLLGSSVSLLFLLFRSLCAAVPMTLLACWAAVPRASLGNLFLAVGLSTSPFLLAYVKGKFAGPLPAQLISNHLDGDEPTKHGRWMEERWDSHPRYMRVTIGERGSLDKEVNVRKLKMSLFDGEDAHGWVYRVESYFPSFSKNRIELTTSFSTPRQNFRTKCSH
ncbi:hypothetical protein M5K25_011007 [Dendrobium thyrsiflorum]|uniref:Uncharacterized protein n=1 Tax=Dendrobium thyrsiflorum TaxID=117978 RepID=A0ABD0V8L1_DENTH